MANITKGERKLVGFRIPVDLLSEVKDQAQRSGLGLNDCYVMLVRQGLARVQESSHAPSQNVLCTDADSKSLAG